MDVIKEFADGDSLDVSIPEEIPEMSKVDMFRYNYFLKKRGGSHSSIHRSSSKFFRQETDEYEITPAPIISEMRKKPTVEDDVILGMYEELLKVITDDIETTPIMIQVKKPDPTLGYCDFSVYSESQDSASLLKTESPPAEPSIKSSQLSQKMGKGGPKPIIKIKKLEAKKSGSKTSKSSREAIEVTREESSITVSTKSASAASVTSHISSLDPIPEWKPVFPDEDATIDFKNGALYIGRLSRKCMEGNGLYRYPDGTIYEGDFLDNIPHGNGTIMWADMSVYIGSVNQGYRHGEGFFVGPPGGPNEQRIFLSGTWKLGKLHGKGLLMQGNMSYEGEFTNGKRTGFATRYYNKKNVYTGNFANGIRSGHGTMVWENNDMYIGSWVDGYKDGYGDYTWEAYKYPEFCFFNQNMFSGNWLTDFRHGFGTLFLTSGVVYDGNWEKNQKHGIGLVVCRNGLIVKSDRLFWLNQAAPVLGDEKLGKTVAPELVFEQMKSPKSPKRKSKKSAPPDTPSSVITEKESFGTGGAFPPTKQELRMLNQIQEYISKTRRMLSEDRYQPRSIPLNLPDHHIMLEYHLNRVKNNNPLLIKFKQNHVVNISYDSMVSFHTAPFDPSCSNIYNLELEKCESPEIDTKVKTKPPALMPSIYTTKCDFDIVEAEEYYLRNMITYRLEKLRSIYDKYASIGLREDFPMSQKPVLVRLFMWQFFRDCGIPYKGIKLIQLDRSISENVSSCVLYDHAPYERIQFFQFLHAILEVSWLLYGRYMNIHTTQRGVLASSLDMFLTVDVIPGTQDFAGSALFRYRDLVPIEAVQNLYKDIGDPPTVRDFLNATRETWDKKGKSLKTLPKTITGSKRIVEGTHSVIGETVIFDPGAKENILQDSVEKLPVGELLPWNLTGLKVIKDLTLNDILQCCTDICPGVLCNEIIADIDYELTLLEFYEILIHCVDRIFYNIEYLKWKALEDERILVLTKLLKQIEGKKGKKDKKKKK